MTFPFQPLPCDAGGGAGDAGADVEQMLLCDVLPDGQIAGTAIAVYEYDADGNPVGPPTFVDPVTGAPYAAQGVLQPCPGNIGCAPPTPFCFTTTTTGPVEHPGRTYDITLPINPGFAVDSLQIDATSYPANITWAVTDADGAQFATALQAFLAARFPGQTVTVNNPNAGTAVCGQAIPMTVHIECARIDDGAPDLVDLVYNGGRDLVVNPAYLTTPPTNLNGPQFVYVQRQDAGGILNCTSVANQGWETNDGPPGGADFELWGQGPGGLQTIQDTTPTPRGTPVQEITADFPAGPNPPTIWQTFTVPAAGTLRAVLVHGARDNGEQHRITLSTGDTDDNQVGDIINNVTNPPQVTNAGGGTPGPWTTFSQDVALGAGVYTFAISTTNPIGQNRGGLFTDMRVFVDSPDQHAAAITDDDTCTVTTEETITTTTCEYWQPRCTNGEITAWVNVADGEELTNAAFWGQAPAPSCCPTGAGGDGSDTVTAGNMVHNYDVCGVVNGTPTTLQRVVITDQSGGVLAQTFIGPDGGPLTPTSWTVGECGGTEACRDSTAVLLCDAPADDITTVSPAITDGTVADVGQGQFQTLAGPYGALWAGGTLAYPASAGPGQVYPMAVGRLTAAPAGCDDAAGDLTVSVRVTQTGPGTGQAWDGALRVFRGTTLLADNPVRTYAPPGWVQTLTVTVPVTAADLAAGDIRVALVLETFHGTSKGWNADQFSASVDLVGCTATSAVQFLRTVVTDCESGAVVSTTDTDLDGAPYFVAGTVGQCVTVVESSAVGADTEVLTLCDDGPVEPVPFLRRLTFVDGALTSTVDTDLDGAPYLVTGDAVACDATAEAERDAEVITLCDFTGDPPVIAVTAVGQPPAPAGDAPIPPVSEVDDWVTGASPTLIIPTWGTNPPTPRRFNVQYEVQPPGAAPCGPPTTVHVKHTFTVRNTGQGSPGTNTVSLLLRNGGVTVDSETIGAFASGSARQVTLEADVPYADLLAGDIDVHHSYLVWQPTIHPSFEVSNYSMVVTDVAASPACVTAEFTQFLRHFVYAADGTIASHYDTTLEGSLYTVTGTVGICQPSTADTAGRDVEQTVLCDDNGPFLRVYQYGDDSGTPSGVPADYTLAGAPYVPVGAVGQCSDCCPQVIGNGCTNIGSGFYTAVRDADGTISLIDSVTGAAVLAADIIACPSDNVTRTLTAQARLVGDADAAWTPGADVVGTLTSVSMAVLSGTATLIDQSGTVLAGLPAGFAATWSAEDDNTLSGPTSIDAVGGSTVVHWTQR